MESYLQKVEKVLEVATTEDLKWLLDSCAWKHSKAVWDLFLRKIGTFTEAPITLPQDFYSPTFDGIARPLEEIPLQNYTGQPIPEMEMLDPRNFYTLSSPRTKETTKFKTRAMVYDVTFKHLEDLEDVAGTQVKIFGSILEELFSTATVDCKLGLWIQHPALENGIPIPLTTREKLTAEKVAAEFEKVQQSKKTLTMDTSMQLTETTVEPPLLVGN